MILTIEVNMDAARIAAAMAEIKREGGMRRGVYPKLIDKGTLVQATADAQIKALADAFRVLEAAVVASEELPFFADSANAHSTNVPHPTEGAPLCRFCGKPGECSPSGNTDNWKCATPGCTGAQGWVTRYIFQGGK